MVFITGNIKLVWKLYIIPVTYTSAEAVKETNYRKRLTKSVTEEKGRKGEKTNRNFIL